MTQRKKLTEQGEARSVGCGEDSPPRAAQKYFITATGTDQGKTLVTAALCWQLRQRGVAVEALKPIISGGTGDSEVILQSLGREVNATAIAKISPWQFSAPLSPDEAARREGREVVLEEVKEYLCHPAGRKATAQDLPHAILERSCAPAFGRPQDDDVLIIEGAGGVMSPLSSTATNLDLITAIGAPVILVSASYLGCVSHILTAVEVLQSQRVKIAGVVLSQVNRQAQPVEVTLPSLRPHLSADILLLTINHLESDAEMWKNAQDLTSLVWPL